LVPAFVARSGYVAVVSRHERATVSFADEMLNEYSIAGEVAVVVSAS
jgi:hypothetical protein